MGRLCVSPLSLSLSQFGSPFPVVSSFWDRSTQFLYFKILQKLKMAVFRGYRNLKVMSRELTLQSIPTLAIGYISKSSYVMGIGIEIPHNQTLLLIYQTHTIPKLQLHSSHTSLLTFHWSYGGLQSLSSALLSLFLPTLGTIHTYTYLYIKFTDN